MAEGTIRINKVLKDFNIGLSTLSDFLKKKGYTDELTLTSKISEDIFALVAKEFGKEQLIKEQSRKVAIKVKEITEMESSRAIEEEEPVQEVIIKTNVFTEQKKVDSPAPESVPAPEEKKVEAPVKPKSDIKVVGHIDLTPKKKQEPAPAPSKPVETAEAAETVKPEKVEKPASLSEPVHPDDWREVTGTSGTL